jgi:hypothetical protein
MLQKLLFRIYLYFKGIRFYETECIPKSPEFRRAVFDTVNKKTVEFFFYREICEDLIFRRGKLSKETFIGYVIQARFDNSFPDRIVHFNNMKFFFNSKNILFQDESQICDIMLHIYLDFLKAELRSD